MNWPAYQPLLTSFVVNGGGVFSFQADETAKPVAWQTQTQNSVIWRYEFLSYGWQKLDFGTSVYTIN